MSEQERPTSQETPKAGLNPLFIGFLVVGVFLVAIFLMIMLTQGDVSETHAPATLSAIGQEGKALYLGIGNCNSCHAKEGRASGIGPRLSTTNLSDDTIAGYVRKGKGAMPPNSALTDEQIKKIIIYIRELKPA